MNIRVRSITTVLSFALLPCAAACSAESPAPPAGAGMGVGGASVAPGGAGTPAASGSTGMGMNPTTTAGAGGAGGMAAQNPPSAGSGGGAGDSSVPAAGGSAGGAGDSSGGSGMGGAGGGPAEIPPYETGVEMGCDDDPNPDDPTIGWTPIEDPWPSPDGAEYPHLEHPYDLPDQENCVTDLPIDDRNSPCRFRREGNLWTHWIFETDETHRHPDEGYAPTRPRIEFHWSHFSPDDDQPERMWTGDVKILGDGEGTQPQTNTIIQVHAETTGAGPVYLRVHDGQLFELGDRSNPYHRNVQLDTWYNIKVAYSAVTHISTVYINNCEVGSHDGSDYAGRNLPGGDLLYFKNGSYGCDTGLCIVQFANIQFYAR